VPLLEWFPQQPHHLLKADGRTLKAGGTFEAAPKDVGTLLASPDIRKAPAPPKPPEAESKAEPKTTPKTTQQTQSPIGQSAQSQPDRRP
jgi:hypothetical protein